MRLLMSIPIRDSQSRFYYTTNQPQSVSNNIPTLLVQIIQQPILVSQTAPTTKMTTTNQPNSSTSIASSSGSSLLPSQQNPINSITLQYFSSQQQKPTQISFPQSILSFNIELLHNNPHEPYPIPQQITTSDYPFAVMKQFLEAHKYQAKGVVVTKPITSKHYHQLVDQVTYQVCQKFTLLSNSQPATQVVNLCRFLRFHQLHDAVCCAIATNYFIPENDQNQLSEFRKRNKIDELSSEEICEVIKEYEDVFIVIETKAKEEFLKGQRERGNGVEEEEEEEGRRGE